MTPPAVRRRVRPEGSFPDVTSSDISVASTEECDASASSSYRSEPSASHYASKTIEKVINWTSQEPSILSTQSLSEAFESSGASSYLSFASEKASLYMNHILSSTPFSQENPTLLPGSEQSLGASFTTSNTNWNELAAAFQLPGYVMDSVDNKLLKPVVLFIYPIVKPILSTLTNPQSQRKALNRIIYSVAFLILFSLGILLYTGFYHLYMPQSERHVPVYLDYPTSNLPRQVSNRLLMIRSLEKWQNVPWGKFDFSSWDALDENQDKFFIQDEVFDLQLGLVVPESHHNFMRGNFMVMMELYNETSSQVPFASSSRPGMIRHKSNLLQSASTLYKLPSLLTGRTHESQYIKIPMMERLTINQNCSLSHVIIALSDTHLHIYETHLIVKTRFQGLPYYMYHRYLITGALFVLFFMIMETVVFYIWWKCFVFYRLRQKRMQTEAKIEKDQEATSSECSLMADEDDDVFVEPSVGLGIELKQSLLYDT